MVKTLIPAADDKGKRVDSYIAETTGLTRSYVRTLIEKSLININGTPIKKCGECVNENDIIELSIPPLTPLSATPEDIPLDIVYEDEDIIVVNKPQGMVTHPATGSPKGTLVNALMYNADKLSGINGVIRPGIVHRLDKDTSGLLVVAKNDASHNSLASQIAERTAKRFYIALVFGNIKEDSGIIDKPIARNPKNRKLMGVVLSGKDAVTRFRVLERFNKYTLVEFELKTGRTHQIRVHAKSISHPVVGDTSYGGDNRFELKGQLLHAHKLILTHPVSGDTMEFCAPLPEYFEAVLNKLRKSIR